MRTARVILVSSLLLSSVGTAGAQARQVDDTLELPRSMAAIRSRFARGSRPVPTDLVGRWTMQRDIIREDNSTGQRRDTIFGARRQDIAGHPFEWTFRIRRVSGARYVMTPHNPWTPTEFTKDQ